MALRLLDLFCKAGGAGMGYYRAGFEVTGVDLEPQPRYPFEFHQADALEFLAEHGHEFDVIHASPPCQAYSAAQHLGRARNGDYPEHPDLIGSTQELIYPTGRPFVIENVSGARSKLGASIMLCGLTFGLKVYRHRYFEVSPYMLAPAHIAHNDQTPSAGNGKSPKGFISVCGSGGVRGMNAGEILEYWSYAMGIDWMTRDELAEAIPPAYTEWIGRHLIEALGGAL
jgi:DNA (cytosine-5)-methyltransferase 1